MAAGFGKEIDNFLDKGCSFYGVGLHLLILSARWRRWAIVLFTFVEKEIEGPKNCLLKFLGVLCFQISQDFYIIFFIQMGKKSFMKVM